MIDVMIVDDSALVRKVLTDIIESERDLNLVGTAYDPLFAVEILKKKRVDVIVLDIEMPRMDGLTFLDKLMRVYPTTVIILSSLTMGNPELVLKALATGAFDVISKPDDILTLPELKREILEKIRQGATSEVRQKLLNQFKSISRKTHVPVREPRIFTASTQTTDKVIAIGSSTGGTSAIMDILSELPVDIPGIVIVQHMPLRFSEPFAQRLDQNLELNVRLAAHNDSIKPGTVYIAPGDLHCEIVSSGAKYLIHLSDGPRVNYHKPSVEPLFLSTAKHVGSNSVGIMLTGMGEDGAQAMRAMKEAGSYNIVQDEASSVVWGMPGKAVEYGASSVVLPLNKIAGHLCKYLKGEIR